MLFENDLYIKEIIEQIQKLGQIQVLFLTESLDTKVTTLVADSKYSLVVELNDDTKQTTLESTELATILIVNRPFFPIVRYLKPHGYVR